MGFYEQRTAVRMNFMQQLRTNKQGFLLVDAIIGVLVVAIGLAALAALYTYGIGVMVSADRQEKAVQIAAEKIELLKAADGHSVVDLQQLVEHINNNEKSLKIDDIIYDIDANIEKSSLDSTYPGDSNLSLVRVEIKWTDPRQQVLNLQTYIRTKE